MGFGFFVILTYGEDYHNTAVKTTLFDLK